MAASFLSTLPKSLRQAWPIIVGGVRQGLSGNAIQGVLRSAGLGVRRQTLLDGVRLLREGFAKWTTLRLLGTTVRPPLRMIPRSLTRIRREFSYLLEIEEIIDNVVEKRFMTLSSNELLNRKEAELTASRMLEEDVFKYGKEVVIISSNLTGILKAGQLGTL